VNDRVLPIGSFTAGLKVTFSEQMHPATASASSFVVSLEVPSEDPGLRRTLVVDGGVLVGGGGTTWTFVPSFVDSEDVGRWAADLGGRVRCRVRLLSNAILDSAGERPLDGEAVGRVVNDGYESFVDLILPSGDGQRGGDFDSWFFLTGPAPRVRVDHVNPADGTRFHLGPGPRTILLTFSDGVRFASIDESTLTVSLKHSSDDREGDGDAVSGTIEPYPYETEPGVVSQVTFTPTETNSLRPIERPTGDWIVTIRARGTRGNPIVDTYDRPLDGAGEGRPSDFVARFYLGPGV
jgi:hypothetical protein